MIKLGILGVTPVSDLYPNVKYKIRILSALRDVETRLLMHDLGASRLHGSFSAGGLMKLGKVCRTGWGHLNVFIRFLIKPLPNVYICYPGIFLVCLLGLIPKSRRPRIFLDAFISIYDSAIIDRKMYGERSLPARLLYWIEKRAFQVADVILVDTRENAAYYSELFGIPSDRFIEVPLSIPPLREADVSPEPRGKPGRNDSFTCLFVGSLIPLHGIECILDAARHLRDDPAIRFRIIGDGQQGHLIDAFRKQYGLPNLAWEKGIYPTNYLVSAIRDADLCLGIFGHTPKAERVFPYKLYYYMMLGKAVISGRTRCLNRHNDSCNGNLLLVDPDGESLAAAIRKVHDETGRLHELEVASGDLFNRNFSEKRVKEKMTELIMNRCRQ